MTVRANPKPLVDPDAAMDGSAVVALLLAAVIGAFLAVAILPAWLPGLSGSLGGPEPKGYWYLSRASAFVAFGLLWLAMLCGLSITTRMARVWPGGPTAFDLHQHASLLGLAFALFHALILTGDRYISFSLFQVLLPFSTTEYHPLEIGLGQLSFYALGIVAFSFYVRGRIGRRVWRLIHYLSFAIYGLVLWHGLGGGTDGDLMRVLAWGSGLSLLVLTGIRLGAAIWKRVSRAVA